MARQNFLKRQKPDLATMGVNLPDIDAIGRLSERRQNLNNHMRELESEIVDIGRKIAGLDETLFRLRQGARPKKTTVR